MKAATSAADARAILASGELGFPLVVKADGLAAGKGVVVAADGDEAEAAIRRSDRGSRASRWPPGSWTSGGFFDLLGVRPDRADALIADGHRLRVYVPYGTYWYEYSVRRLQENPKIAGYVAGDLGRSLLRRR